MNGAVKKGDNVLITGIGGGVALIALQICVAQGANVYVTSGGADKIQRAVELGAKGGVSYKASMSQCLLRRGFPGSATDYKMTGRSSSES